MCIYNCQECTKYNIEYTSGILTPPTSRTLKVYQSIYKYMMVYTLYTDMYLYILVYQNNIGHIQAYTVTCDCYIFHAEAPFHDVCATSDTHPKYCMT